MGHASRTPCFASSVTNFSLRSLHVFSFFFLLGKCEYNPIGLDNIIDFPSDSFDATSEQAGYLANYSRFDSNGWCANDTSDGVMNLTIDFGRLFKVCAVATAGIQYQDGRDSYISSLDVSFSVDGSTWDVYPTVKLFKS